MIGFMFPSLLGPGPGWVLLGLCAWCGHLHVVSLHRPLPVAIFLFDLGNDPEATHWFGRLIGHFDCRLPASGRLDGIFVQCLNLISLGVVQIYHLEHGLKMFEQASLPTTGSSSVIRQPSSVSSEAIFSGCLALKY